MSNDGGPAFPSEQHETQDGTWNQTYCPGMSLRDYFAGQAMAGITAGLCANPGVLKDEPYRMRAMGRLGFSDAAKDAYTIADAMLAARSKP